MHARSDLVYLAFASVLLAGCGRTEAWLLASSGTVDAGSVMNADAGISVDAGPPDSGPRDSGSPAPGQVLADVLTCGLDPDEALRAATRLVGCSSGIISLSGMIETYEAFLWGAVTPGLTRTPTSCGLWRCAAEIDRCDDLSACLSDIGLSGTGCRGSELACRGDVLASCVSPHLLPHIDCAALGATCQDGACVKNGCRFGNGEATLRCSEDGSPSVTLCDGEYEVDCEAWGFEGSTCESLYVQGEIPVAWCAPPGIGSVAGGYNLPVSCRGGVVEFDVVGGRHYRLDCRSLGYRDCDEDGCVE